MAKQGKLIITHEVSLKGFDGPLLDPRLINRGLRRAGTVVKEEVQETITTEHKRHKHNYREGQLVESVTQQPVDTQDQSVTVKFKGKREEVHTRRKKDGSKGGTYQRFNKTVAFFLNFYKKFYDRNKERIQGKAIEGFRQEISKRKR